MVAIVLRHILTGLGAVMIQTGFVLGETFQLLLGLLLVALALAWSFEVRNSRRPPDDDKPSRRWTITWLL